MKAVCQWPTSLLCVFVMPVYASSALCTGVAGCAAMYAARKETNGP